MKTLRFAFEIYWPFDVLSSFRDMFSRILQKWIFEFFHQVLRLFWLFQMLKTEKKNPVLDKKDTLFINWELLVKKFLKTLCELIIILFFFGYIYLFFSKPWNLLRENLSTLHIFFQTFKVKNDPNQNEMCFIEQYKFRSTFFVIDIF